MAIDWRASMITPPMDLGSAPMFRRVFRLDSQRQQVERATLHISSLGVNDACLNGRPVSAEVLNPGWSAFEWRVRYRSHDVTALLEDENVLTVCVGNGWFRGRLGLIGGRAAYGDRLGLIAQLEIEYADGSRQLVVSDASWTAGCSDVVADDLYDGQIIDARRRSDAWYVPGASLDYFFPAEVMSFDAALLVPYLGPAVCRHEVLEPVACTTSPSGRTVVDFGQNIVGWVRFAVKGKEGEEIRVRYAEVLDGDDLCTRPLRSAQATDRFILSGGVDLFEPTKTFHGFRFAEISGWPTGVGFDSLEAVVVHSDLARIGSFECSDPLLNQLHQNVVWSMKGNFLALPTDCPQRDERLGWTGDIAVFAPSAAYLYDVNGFLSDWLVDLAHEQAHAEGRVPLVVPDIFKLQPAIDDLFATDTVALWSDAAVWVPWALWLAYGDRTVLERQFESMAAHVRRAATKLSASGLWDTGIQLGDWLDPDAPPDAPWDAKADAGVVATACFYRSAVRVATTARLLGQDAEAHEFLALANRTRRAFVAEYVDAAGKILSDCATVYSLAIVFDLLDQDAEQLAGERLAELVAGTGYRISTGFAGTPFILDALSKTGHVEDAYLLLTQLDCPSWLYPVTMGATTVWERWDSMLPDGTINPGEMTSFNHYALGSIVDWMHRTIGGIAPLEPGYRRVLIAPRPGGGLTWANAALETPHGPVRVSWRKEPDGHYVIETHLPEGVTGVLSWQRHVDLPVPEGWWIQTVKEF